MSCEILPCCRFFSDKMKNMPKTADYIRNKLCFNDYEACVRYRIYKEFGGDNVPFDLYPDDTEEVHKVIRCLRSKQRMIEGGCPDATGNRIHRPSQPQ